MKHLVYLALTAGLLLPGARADEWNKKLLVTVKQAVQVPGKTLDPGTYIFRLQDSQSNRTVVQIYNQEESHLLQTVQAFPDYRMIPTKGVSIQLEERAVGEPQAIKAIFFPGDNYGQEFVYPPVAPATAAVVVSQKAIVAAATPAPAPAPAPAPQAAPAPTPAPEPAPAPAPAPQVAMRQKALPHTAGNEPLFALVGLLSLGAAFGLAALRRSLA